jgi:hypothetical protein
VIRLLADANITGHVFRLTARMQAESWREFWDFLELRLVSFQDVGLDLDDTDATVWLRCQQEGIVLLTNNRNDDGPDSLEATIRTHNSPDRLPVFTIGAADQILTDAEYAEAVAESLFDYLLRLDAVRGTGRLFLP